jgi:AcrR family transcriptional regulator
MKATLKKKLGRPVDRTLRARREQEILDEAIKLFAEVGYHAADTQALANRLGVGKGTLYRYFPSKEKLFLAATDRCMQRLQAAVDASMVGVEDPLDWLAHGVRAYLAFFADHPEFVELFIQERAEFKDRKKPTYFEHKDANIGRWHDVFRTLIAGGRVRDIPVQRITDVLSDLVYGTMFTNYFTGRPASFAKQTADILDIVFHGILTRTERKR